ncbi:MAG TPA: hypothetical protein DHU96_23295 [Actinobacteria bacterium]|nr:hypothetical protein [Actinomycetota bacterium]
MLHGGMNAKAHPAARRCATMSSGRSRFGPVAIGQPRLNHTRQKIRFRPPARHVDSTLTCRN